MKRSTSGSPGVQGPKAKKTKTETEAPGAQNPSTIEADYRLSLGICNYFNVAARVEEEAAGVLNPSAMNSNSNSVHSAGGPVHQEICQNKTTINNNNGAARVEEEAAGVLNPSAMNSNSNSVNSGGGRVHQEICQNKTTINNNNGAARAEEGAAAAAGEVADKNDCRLLGVPSRSTGLTEFENGVISEVYQEPSQLTVFQYLSRQIARALATEAAYKAKDHGFSRVVWEDAPASGSTDDLLRNVLKRMGVNKDTRGFDNEEIEKEIKKKCMQWKNDGIKSLLILNGVCDDDVLVHLQHFTSIIVTTDVAGFGEGKVASRKCIELGEAAPERSFA